MMIDISVVSTEASAVETAIPVATTAGARLLAKAATATAPENPTVLDPACVDFGALEQFAKLRSEASFIAQTYPSVATEEAHDIFAACGSKLTTEPAGITFKDGGYADIARTASREFEEQADVVLNSSAALYAGTAGDTILRAMRQLKPGGFGYVLVRHSTLSKSLPGTLRQQLRANGHIPVAVHLPNGLLKNTDADCFLLVLSKDRRHAPTIVIDATRETDIEGNIAHWVEEALAPEQKICALHYRTKQWAEGATPHLDGNLVETHSWAETGGFDYAHRSGALVSVAGTGFRRPPVSAEERELEFESMNWRYGYLKDVEAYIDSAVREYVKYTQWGAVDVDEPQAKDHKWEIRRHFALPHLQEEYLAAQEHLDREGTAEDKTYLRNIFIGLSRH